MSLLRNYVKDLQKSKTTPLLIELSKKDLDSLSKEDKSGLDISSYVAKEIYDKDMEDTTESNLIFIDADKSDDLDNIFLLEEFLKQIKDQVKEIKNLDIAKKGISKGLSFATGGVLDSAFGGFIDQGVDLVVDNISNGFTDILIETALEHVDLSDKLLGMVEEKINEGINDISIHFLDEMQKNKICLSSDAKKALSELSKKFKEDITYAESFRLILQLMLSIAIDKPKILFIKNPHKLDKNSLAILSMLFSFSKDAKDKEKHTGLSVIYAYDDEAFQPYSEVKEEFKQSKTLLDEQRRYTQRYAMLERPTSDIPHIAVKSSMFVGRQEELENLNERYHYSKEHNEVATLETISGEPGIGKTKLIKKHLEQIRKEESEGAKQIQLTLLNQVGHTSSNVGLSSLIDSIVKEAQRLETVKTLTEKAFDIAKDGVRGFIKSALGVDAVIEIGTAFKDRVELESQMEQTQLNTRGDLDNKSQDKKQGQFTNLNRAIKKLQELSDDTMPIVLFIDDLQWIDEDSAEYIIEHFIKAFNVHMVSSIRPSDATTMLKQAYTNKGLNPYKVALLKEVGIKIYDNDNHEIVIDSDINTQKIESNATHLSGLDTDTLQDLISKVIQGDASHQKTLAATIIKKLNNDAEAKYEVNTLFAVETINMLCDEKLYSETDSIERLILNDISLRFNTEVKDFKAALEHTFEVLHDKYETAFEHINANQEETEFKQKFNLMAYAVLEERLHILKIYFDQTTKHGNAAVNTLLFSSLLGTPFNSTIVKNILDALATTDEELLQPLKKYILEGNDEISLNASHYEIIEEVYEILSRYKSLHSAYEHRHSLLNTFLDKQLEYQLDKEFKKDTINAKNSLYTLVLSEIKKEEEQQDFYKAHESSLESKQYESMIFYQQTKQNVLVKAYQQDPSVWAKAYTTNLMYLADSYYNGNQIEKAITLQEEALKIIEELYVSNPERWEKELIISLNMLAHSLKSIGKTNKSIELGIKSLAITKELYSVNPDYWITIYTASLNGLGLSLQETGDTNRALELFKEALSITKKLYTKYPDQIMDSYIISLTNLAYSLKSIGKINEAIEFEKESLAIRKELYSKNPDSWVEKYTIGLTNLAISLKDIGKSDEAIELNKELLAITKELYNKNPERWAEGYTSSLTNLAAILKDKGDTDKAVELFKEALAIRKELYSENADLWVKYYTNSLTNLAAILNDIELFKEALAITKEQYTENSKQWAKSYIISLHNFAHFLKNNGKINETIELEKEALTITKELFTDNQELWAEDYIRSFENLAYSLKSIGKSDERIELNKELLVITKELYNKNPEKWAEDYIRIYNNFTILLNDIGKSNESIELSKELLVITKELYNKNPERGAEAYIKNYNTLAVFFRDRGDLYEAVKLFKEELVITKDLYHENPEKWAEKYTQALHDLSIVLNDIGKSDEAVEVNKEALTIRKEFYKEDPEKWAEDYTNSLNNLAYSLDSIGETNQLIEIEKELLATTKELYYKTPSRWEEMYKRSLNNLSDSLNDLVISYYNLGQIDKAIDMAITLNTVCEENGMESSDFNYNAIQILGIQKKEPASNAETKYYEPFTTLLYIAKGLAIYQKSDEIGVAELYDALNSVELSPKAEKIFRQVFGDENMDNFYYSTAGYDFIKIAKNHPIIEYEEGQMKGLVAQLKEIFEDHLILNVREASMSEEEIPF